ncbi:MAG: hypothetical protein QW374_03560 [Candidatus Bathyarchaeia archaeon]|nr:hypothetical protein [Candidatus Bathyarchaeota archaeon]
MDRIVYVDRDRCIDVSSRIKTIGVVYRRMLDGVHVDLEYKLRLLLYFTAICYDTRRVWGYIDGVYYRGSDYIYHAMLKKLMEGEFFDTDRMRELSLEEFGQWFEEGVLTRIDERLKFIRDTARMLELFYDGMASKLIEESGYRLSGSGGFVDRLSRFKAFSDPLAKKIMVLASLIEFEGLAFFKDSDSMEVGVDYHLQRIALRTGMVRIADRSLSERIARGRFVSKPIHDAIRGSCLEAYRIIIDEAGFKPREVDAIFWNLGRSCCSIRRPSCKPPCIHSDICSFTTSTTYECMGGCILGGICEASGNRDFIKLKEPRYRTYYY